MNRNHLYLVVALLGFGIGLASWSFGQQQQDLFGKSTTDAINKFNSCEYQWGLCRRHCADEHPLQRGIAYTICKDGCDNAYDRCIKNPKGGKGSIQRGGSSSSGGKTHDLEPVTTATPKRRLLQGTEAVATQAASATATPTGRLPESSKASGTQETAARKSKLTPTPTPTATPRS
jgi:hypothetical protein